MFLKRPISIRSSRVHFTSQQQQLKVASLVHQSYGFRPTSFLLVILTLRTWAVWDRGRTLGFGLAILFVVCWGTILPFIILYIKDLECEKTNSAMICTVTNKIVLQVLWVDSPAFSGCSIVKGSHFATVCWVLLLAYETGVFFVSV